MCLPRPSWPPRSQRALSPEGRANPGDVMLITCGEALVDVLPDGTSVPGGGPMNAAIAASRLGTPTAFVGRVSNDDAGEQIWAHLQASNVDLVSAQRGPEATARAIVTTVPVQSFRFEGEGTADASMTGLDVSGLEAGPHIIHGGTLGIFRGTTADVLADWIESAEMATSIVSFDPNVRPQIIKDRDHWWSYADRWLARADVVKGSDEDFDWMGTSVPDLLARGIKVVLRTIGADGVEAFLANGEQLAVPGVKADFVDAVGAGDSFCGAVLTRLDQVRRGHSLTGHDLSGRSLPSSSQVDVADLDLAWWQETLGFAVRVAAITVSRPGADPPWASEVV